jgi:hypothetical protein
VVSDLIDAQRAWMDAQKEMVSLSSNSSQRIAAAQDHASLTESEQGAAVSTQAILDVLASIRTGAPLETE